MNLNDIRANAYKNGARKGERSADESAMKAAGVQAPNEEGESVPLMMPLLERRESVRQAMKAAHGTSER